MRAVPSFATGSRPSCRRRWSRQRRNGAGRVAAVEVLFGTPASEFRYRFNWQAPFFVSKHEPGTIYMAGNVVFRTRDEGMTWGRMIVDWEQNMTERIRIDGSKWLSEYFGQEFFSPDQGPFIELDLYIF